MQTYEEYLETMRAYDFHALKQDQWRDWQIHYHGKFKTSTGYSTDINTEET